MSKQLQYFEDVWNSEVIDMMLHCSLCAWSFLDITLNDEVFEILVSRSCFCFQGIFVKTCSLLTQWIFFQLCSDQFTINSFIKTCTSVLLSLEVTVASVGLLFWMWNLWKFNLPMCCFLIVLLNALSYLPAYLHQCFWIYILVYSGATKAICASRFFYGGCPLSTFQEIKFFVNCNLLYY